MGSVLREVSRGGAEQEMNACAEHSKFDPRASMISGLAYGGALLVSGR